MTSQYRHRRTSSPTTAFPNPLEPGEIAVNTSNRQIAVGDANTGTTGLPLPLIALRYFDAKAKYAVNDLVQNGAIVYRAKNVTGPGSFAPADWDMLVGTFDPQYVAKAGDVMTGMLTLPATVPSIGTHAANKAYVDAQDATKSTVYVATTPPAGVPDNSLWWESDTGLLYIKYNDGNTTQWVIASPQPDTTNFVLRTGDTMTGALNIPITPTLPANATSKSYVDAQLANKSSVISSDTPPPAPVDNTLWFESDTGLTYLRYNDGNGPAQWIGIADSGMGAVRYDFAQGLTTNQMAQARSNAGVTKKNYIINGAMMISQENGSTASAANAYYPVDNFFISTITSGVCSSQQIASRTLGGSPNRWRTTVTTADTSVAAGEIVAVIHRIEGLKAADLKFGATDAKSIVLQFGVKAPAGTYSVAFRNPNSGVIRSYIGEYIIASGEANTDVVKTIALTGDTVGTGWRIDNLIGLEISWALMSGTTYGGAPGVWTGSDFYASSSQFNFMGTNGNVFELFDVSLTEGTTAPPFQVPDHADELALCQRYYHKRTADLAGGGQVGWSVGTCFMHPVIMRATPTVAATGGTPSATSTLQADAATANGCRVTCAVTITGGAYWTQFILTAAARL